MAASLAAGSSLGAALGRLKAARAGPARAALDVFAIRIAAAGFGYGAQVLMARLMGGAEYGIFASVWVWTAILGHTATLGLSQGACRFLPADQARGDLDAARGFLAGGALATLGAALAVTLAGLALIGLDGARIAEPYAAPLLIAALVLPLFALQDYLEGVARSQNWAVLAIAPPYLLRQGLIMATMVAAVLLGAPPRASVALACTLAATGLALALQAVLLRARLRRVLPPGPRRFGWRRWFGACLPIAAVDLAAAGFGFVDVVVLGFLLPPSAVGLYFAATRIQQLVVFVHYAASAATAQRFSALHAQGDRAALAALVRRQARAVFGATALVGLALVALGPLLLGLFGPDFRDSLPILALLIAGSVGASLFGPGEDLLTMLGGERLCAVITGAMLILAALACLALVPAFGPIGAAAGLAGVTLLRGYAMARAARAVHGLATPIWSGLSLRTRP
ncbi:lipopolysaccharide biosynthesis protein [Methylobacterium planeticum]|uniref:Lipopolysaccharide biosynthesis protein n=1 Tax=Methylobacterium planeticum TaxID=2615211 RepID=A0A6N6MUW2_9HYPH|nr:lipopolysaccharide biosynthesis protein [Methylobacterium planeticum]KAB1072637.1 lipopolysaccharide biosynthesis protein [Methylobacterium planeticum]